MTDIIKLARDAGATPYTNRHYPDRPTHTFTVDQLELFAKLVRNAALEQAKQLCEARSMSVASRCGYPEGLKVGAQGCAAAIELLKEPTP